MDGDTFLHVQEWGKVIWFQVPYLLPFLMILLLRWRVIPGWVRMLWLYLPVLVAAYISQNYILHEVRSFWALAPIFTATVACWFHADVVQRPYPTSEALSSESGSDSYVSSSTEEEPPSGSDVRPLL